MECKYYRICEIKNLLQERYKSLSFDSVCMENQTIPNTYAQKCLAFKYFELKGKLNEEELKEQIRTAWSNKNLVLEDLEHLAKSVNTPL